MEELLIKTLIISLVCVGLRMVSSKEMIFYPLRMPYDWLTQRKDKEEIHKTLQANNENGIQVRILIASRIKKLNIGIYALKPFIGCVTCMASTYTIAIDWLYYGHCDRYTILLIFMVACLNTLLYSTFEKLSK